jgi:hypothetical protein
MKMNMRDYPTLHLASRHILKCELLTAISAIKLSVIKKKKKMIWVKILS